MKFASIRRTFATGVLTISCASLFTGCGSDDDGGTTAATSTTLSGTVAKGPFKSGSSVNVFSLTKTGKSTNPIASGTVTSDTGSFSVNIPGTTVGAVVIEASGNYISEIDGTEVSSGGAVQSVAFVDSSTRTFPNLLVTPVTHLVANAVLANPSTATRSTINQIGIRVAQNLGFPAGTNPLSGRPPLIVKANSNASSFDTTQIHMGGILAGFERMRGSMTYHDLVTSVLNVSKDGSLPATVTADLATRINNHFTSVGTPTGLTGVPSTLSGTSAWTSSPFDFSQHTVELFADGKPHSFGQMYTTSMTAGGQVSVLADIGATATAHLTYVFSLVNGSSYVTPLTSVLTGFPSSGSTTGATSFSGVFSTTVPATYTFEVEVGQPGKTVAKSEVTIVVNGTQTSTPAPANPGSSATFTFGSFTADMLTGKKFHSGYNGTPVSYAVTNAMHSFYSFVDAQNFVLTRFGFPGGSTDVSQGFGNFVSTGTWSIEQNGGQGFLRWVETRRVPISADGTLLSTAAIAVTSSFREALAPTATASNLETKNIVHESVNSANPFNDDLNTMLGSHVTIHPISTCGGTSSLRSLPLTTAAFISTESTATGCSTIQ